MILVQALICRSSDAFSLFVHWVRACESCPLTEVTATTNSNRAKTTFRTGRSPENHRTNPHPSSIVANSAIEAHILRVPLRFIATCCPASAKTVSCSDAWLHDILSKSGNRATRTRNRSRIVHQLCITANLGSQCLSWVL